MRKMKDSGVEWIGDVPQNWRLVRIKACVSRRDSGAWGEEATGKPGDCVCIRVADIDYDRLRLKDDLPRTYRNYEEKVIASLKLADGDILIEKSGGGEKTLVGRAVMFRGTLQAVFANFMERIRCRDFVHSRFLLYVLAVLYQSGYIKNYIKQTTGIQNLDISSMLSKEYLALPPIVVQDRITDYLDRKCSQIDAIIARQQEVIERLKAYKLSVITEAVTKGLNPDVPMKDSGVEWIGKIPAHWENRKMISILSMRVVDGPHESPELYDEGIPYISATAIENGKINFHLMRGYISEKYCDICDLRYKPQLHDILVIKLGASTGQVAIVETTDRFNIWVPLAAVRCNEKADPYFVYYAFQSDYFLKQMEMSWTYGTQQTLGVKSIERLRIMLPTLEEQKEIASYLKSKCDLIDAAVKNKENLIDKLVDYKKSLIYEVVTGKKEV